MHCRLCHLLHQRIDDVITSQFYVENRLTAIYFRVCRLCTTLICQSFSLVHMVDEFTFECTIKYFLLMFQEGFCTYILQFSYHTGSHIDHLLIVIGQFFVLDSL